VLLFSPTENILNLHINVQEEDGKSLLVAAVELRQPQFVSVLLRAGASPNVYNQVHDSIGQISKFSLANLVTLLKNFPPLKTMILQ
jgi:hypothetical protein